MPVQTVIVPLGQKPKPATQRYIDEGKLKFVFSTTGGFNPSAGPMAGVYYDFVGSEEEIDQMVKEISENNNISA